MKIEDFFFRRYGTRRRVNPDGTIRIACSRCGDIICSTNTFRIGVAICHSCATGNPKLKTVPIVDGRPRPDLMQESQEELLRAIFEGERSPEPGSIEDMIMKSKASKFNPLNLARGAFRALAFPTKQKPELDTEKVTYEGADQQSSKTISKQKRRTPIFGKGANSGGSE